MRRASLHVPEVIRTFMRMAKLDRYRVAESVGLTPTQLTRRLTVPGALSAHEVAGLAVYFDVSIDTFYKELPEALTDFGEALRTSPRWNDRPRRYRARADRAD